MSRARKTLAGGLYWHEKVWLACAAPGLCDGERLLLAVLVTYEGKDGRVYPGAGKLAGTAGRPARLARTEGSIRALFQSLEKRGVLRKVNAGADGRAPSGRGHAAEYVIAWDRLQNPTAGDRDPELTNPIARDRVLRRGNPTKPAQETLRNPTVNPIAGDTPSVRDLRRPSGEADEPPVRIPQKAREGTGAANG